MVEEQSTSKIIMYVREKGRRKRRKERSPEL
jgi:hypothetical protein